MSESGLSNGDTSNGSLDEVDASTVEGDALVGEAAEPPGFGGPGDDVFARAVGLAEAPPRDRKLRRTTDPNRPTVTADDAARLLQDAHDGAVGPTPAPVAAPVPVPVETKPSWFQRRRARVRRTRLTVRHVDPWSVLKVSLLVYAVLYVAATLAGVLLWSAAVRSGVTDNIESFVQEVGAFEVWQFDGEEIFRRGTVIGAVLMIAGVAFNVLMAIVFNLVSDLVGGVRLTILEEDGLQKPTV